MFKVLLPILLILVSIGGFIFFVSPLSAEVTELRKDVSAYNQALTNSKSLEYARDQLKEKSNSINTTDVSRLEKLLPDGVDNIKLILEIEENVARPYGMILKDVRYSIEKESEVDSSVVQGGNINVANLKKDYGEWGLEFSVEGTYNNFISFLRDLEKNLRIIDVVSIQFSSSALNQNSKNNIEDIYKFAFKVKTYWLKK